MLHTRICDLLGIEHPIISAPMSGGTAAADLAAAVSEAGGFGLIGGMTAGGIADGRGLAAVLVLGAEGAWMGTRFYASRESGGENWEKDRMLEAGTDDTLLTKIYDLTLESPFPRDVGDRVLRNDYTASWHGRNDDVISQREELCSQVVKAEEEGNARIAAVRAGNAVGMIHEIKPAAEIVREIVAEAEYILRERPGQVLR